MKIERYSAIAVFKRSNRRALFAIRTYKTTTKKDEKKRIDRQVYRASDYRDEV